MQSWAHATTFATISHIFVLPRLLQGKKMLQTQLWVLVTIIGVPSVTNRVLSWSVTIVTYRRNTEELGKESGYMQH